MISTKHAPSERADKSVILRDFDELKQLHAVYAIINALPYEATILNKQRQIVFSNNVLLDSLGINSIHKVLGKRFGEAVNCMHAHREKGGCGTTENCKYCGTAGTIIKSQQNKSKIEDECRITCLKNGETEFYDLKVSATPFLWNKKEYTIFTVVDISHEKRRRILERIFFHDVINKTGSLGGMIELLKNVEDKERMDELIHIMEEITSELNDEILGQRELNAAENKELKTHFVNTNSQEIVRSVVNQIAGHIVCEGKKVVCHTKTVNVDFMSDPILLKRVLINMLKNGLEATCNGSSVTIGCDIIQENLRFWVNNPGYIPENIRLQIFQRSFSTKARNRGLGTYSMKLLGEQYLKGKVSFSTDESEGTSFFITLPL